MWKLSNDGFVMQYMVKGPEITDYTSNLKGVNQLEIEGLLRADIVSEKKKHLEGKDYDFESENWQVYMPYGENMVDFSDFYSILKKIRINAATVIISPKSIKLKARIWSYMALGMYVNDKLTGEIDVPRYKPIKYSDVELNLNEGENILYFIGENLGVRDSRNIFGLQFLDEYAKENLSVTLPDKTIRKEAFKVKEFIDSLEIKKDRLCFKYEPVFGAVFKENNREEDYEVYRSSVKVEYPINTYEDVKIPDRMKSIVVKVKGRFKLSRTLELGNRIKPEYFKDNDIPDVPDFHKNFNVRNYFAHMRSIAQIGSNNRGHFGFCMPNILARKEMEKYNIPFNYPGKITDRERLFTTLDLIEERVDCADFELCGLFRFLKLHSDEVDEKLSQRIKEVLLNFRYWMDMEGSDAMCFWSENHSLMFYYAAMEAGKMYSDEYFLLAKMQGSELYAFGREHILEWITDIEEYGFEEFQSSVYLCVTFAVMLNIIDFCEETISARMKNICDRMLIQLAMQTFDSIQVSPMGRVYRSVLYPFSQGTQSMIELILKDAPVSYGEGWIAFLHGSKYDFPNEMREYINKNLDISYSTGNALIFTKKTKNFCLTSVASPRRNGKKRWENIKNHKASNSHNFTKSINESFHGTSFFEPGTYGYQQHMWSAALSKEAIFFVNHPGATGEGSSMRPGYWFGNGVMPAIVQDNGKNILGAIYHIPDNHPVKFIHLYLPRSRFEKVIFDGNWIFLKSGGGVAGIWCSTLLTPYNDCIFDCELRAYGDLAAYIVICKDLDRYGEFNNFIYYAKSLNPVFKEEKGEEYRSYIKLNGEVFLTWEKGNDSTQEIE